MSKIKFSLFTSAPFLKPDFPLFSLKVFPQPMQEIIGPVGIHSLIIIGSLFFFSSFRWQSFNLILSLISCLFKILNKNPN